LKIIYIIFFFFVFPVISYNQNSYRNKWNELPQILKEKLIVDSNNLTKKNIEYIFQSDSLNISNIDVDDIEFVVNFKNLKHLDVSDNKISGIPQDLYISNLETIDFSNTNISLTKIIEFKYNFKRGEFIYNFDTISSTIIFDKFPEKISVTSQHFNWWYDLTYEWKILLEKNANIYIEDLDDISLQELLQIINLEILIISDENVDDISPVAELKNLVIFDCSKNYIYNISPVFNLEKLGVLICNNNEIIDINGIKNLINLEVLIISKNQISKMEEFSNLSLIEYMDISENQITEINFTKALQHLEFLNIAYNPISDISFLENLTTLEKLYCSEIEKHQKKIMRKNKKEIEIIKLDKGRNAFYLSVFSVFFSLTAFSLSFL
jgi:internalin A